MKYWNKLGKKYYLEEDLGAAHLDSSWADEDKVEHKPAMCPCRKEGGLYPGLH